MSDKVFCYFVTNGMAVVGMVQGPVETASPILPFGEVIEVEKARGIQYQPGPNGQTMIQLVPFAPWDADASAFLNRSAISAFTPISTLNEFYQHYKQATTTIDLGVAANN